MNGTTGTVALDVKAIDELDADAFRAFVEKHLDTDPAHRATWKALCHPTLIEDTQGCLEEMAEELQAAVAKRTLRPNHFKARQLAVVNARLRQVSAVAVRVGEHASVTDREADLLKALVRRVALAVDAHRLECIERDLTPEPHDTALWEVLDELTFTRHDGSTGSTLAEMIAAGHWYHPQTTEGLSSPDTTGEVADGR